jgi:tRNA modification GTPase
MPNVDISNKTIAAIATPFGSGGIGIVRISGPEAFRIAKTVFRGKNNQQFSPEKNTRVLQYGYIIDNETGETLDEVLVVFMAAPHTFTREDVVEIQAHSGSFVLRSILSLVLKSGADIAQPGEFTKRAFLNGRIDLTQAESLAEIIAAGSKAALKIASSKMRGQLKEKVEAARETLLDLRAVLEATIDFPEESEGAGNEIKNIKHVEKTAIRPLKHIVESFERASCFVEGLKIVIAGEPNVGKSSLLNQILQKDKAIVTSMPGTTRDLVEEHISIRGVPVIVTDTAGIHNTDDPVEKVGIKKAEARIEAADIILLVVEASRTVTENENKLYGRVKDKEVVITINKQDLVQKESEFTLPKEWAKRKRVRVSALDGTGIDALIRTIEGVCLANSDKASDEIVPNLRQKQLLERSIEGAERAVKGLHAKSLLETVAIDVAESIDALDEILGEKSTADYLDRVFENFCIGK